MDIDNSVYLSKPSPTFTIEYPHLRHVSGSEPEFWETASFFDSEYNAWRSGPHSPSSAEPAVEEVECYRSTHETERPPSPSLPLWESDVQDQVWETFMNADLETEYSSNLNNLSTLPLLTEQTLPPSQQTTTAAIGRTARNAPLSASPRHQQTRMSRRHQGWVPYRQLLRLKKSQVHMGNRKC